MSDIERVGPHLRIRREVQVIEKYGMQLELGLRHEERPTWEQRFKLEDGKLLNRQEVQELKDSGKVGEGAIAQVVWVEGPADWVGVETEYATLYDLETDGKGGARVWFFGTTDGPIITTLGDTTSEEWVTFVDPAHVQYSAQGNINLLPIFGVARRMEMHRSSIKQRSNLSPTLAEVYLQFVMQNRQYKYELRPVKPLASSPEMDNDEEAPGVRTTH